MSSLNHLYTELNAIGFRVNGDSTNVEDNIDIEKTLVKVLYYIDREGRLLSLLFSWLNTHGGHVIADKFFKEYEKAKEYLGETPWFVGVCAFMLDRKDYRFKKGVKPLKKPHHYRNKDQSQLIKVKGPVDSLERVNIYLAKSSLRLRERDVFSVDELIKENQQYRNRFVYGANWRSEIITAIQNGVANPNKIANLLGIQRSRVSIVFNEYERVTEGLID